MKMHQITYFLAICHEKSFTRAAQRCGVKQPSITVAIKALEKEIGGPLFERGNTIARLTDLGSLVRLDFVRIDRAAANIKRKSAKFIASHLSARKPKDKEASLRTIAMSVAAMAIVMMGLALPPARFTVSTRPVLARASGGIRTMAGGAEASSPLQPVAGISG